MSSILLTGANGFLGTEMADILVRNGHTVYALIRSENEDHAAHRLRAAWQEYPELYRTVGMNVIPVPGDITKEGLGISEDRARELKNLITHVVHTAAETGITKSRDDLFRINLTGTENVLAFSGKIREGRGPVRFLHVSTAYVAGRRKGKILETDEPAETFSSYYEEAKAKAEHLVKNSGIPYTIVRPAMIVGNSVTGRVRKFDTIYYMLKLVLSGKVRILPISMHMKVNMLPVDHIAADAVKALFLEEACGKTFHLTCPEDRRITAGRLLAYTRQWAEKKLGITLPKTVFLPVSGLKKLGEIYNTGDEEKQKSVLRNLAAISPYFFDEHDFDRTNTDTLLGRFDGNMIRFMDPILSFAASKNFLHQTEDTVFEQANVRRASRRHPVSYVDVTANGNIEVSGEEMNEKVRRVTGGLIGLGVKKGDRVAMAGINCTDYAALDMASGLLGAVTVPIYYTTPVGEIDLLLERSGAKWLFVGDRRIMENIDALQSTIPVIAFANALTVVDVKRKVTAWSEFLGDPVELSRSPAGPDDLATIRYTSGTTGEPKGVMFSFRQLRWMGSVMAAIVPYASRQKEMRYLSFLPLSHVVEGILASYAPYYMLCPAKLYYLNDFNALTEALPGVRSTVFFSVPRFYEKLWDQLTKNKLGQKYLAMQDGPAKEALGKVLKRAVLRKAGLDACDQLIVGSAPMSEELLLSFRKLGIEIHNAYGETEAPLMTLNYYGDNVIPSIGAALPETEIRVAEDGELIVRGPQVALGYYGQDSDTIRDGVLMTGDLGRIDERGHVYLIGRKKEMIITAYGKNVNCLKVESRIRDIPGVSEAVLIGERRPYCTALLWLESPVEDLHERIEEMNKDLSHPEQIKKWTVIETPLSIAREELTPNLKVRRSNVVLHYREEIEAMYADAGK